MREFLNEILRQSVGLFEKIKVIADEEAVNIHAVSDDQLLFLNAKLKPCSDLIGQFGLSNLDILHGLLEFPSYRTDNAKLIVKRDTKPKVGETVVAFNFVDQNGNGARYATMSPLLIDTDATIPKIDWEIETTPTRSRISEFSKLVSLYKSISKEFKVKVMDKNLILMLGENHDTTHDARVLFASDIEGKLSNESMKYSSDLFLNVLRIANGNNVPKISISGRGPMKISLITDLGTYEYTMRTADSAKKK